MKRKIRQALLVGIKGYLDDTLITLNHVINDVEEIAEVLQKFGNFKVKYLPEIETDNGVRGINHYPRFSEEVNTNMLKEEIKNLLTLSEEETETVLLFFAGHGWKDDDEVSYLATSNAKKNENWGVSLSWLLEELQKSKIKEQIVLLDCCHSGGFFDNIKFLKESFKQKGIKRCLISASRKNEVALADPNVEHGMLTAALLGALDPNNSKGSVSNDDLETWVDKKLKKESQQPLCFNFGNIIITDKLYEGVAQTNANYCPYKSLNFFEKNDGHLFHGRTTLTNQLLDKILDQNIVIVWGASGSGKSSVLRAGLLYQLERGEQEKLSNRGTHHWKYYEPFTPQEHPLENLKNIVNNTWQLSLDDKAEIWVEKLTKSIDSLPQQKAILVVDQFEECFIMCTDEKERKLFFHCLFEIVKASNKKLHLVLGMRIDFSGKFLEYKELANHIDEQENLVMVRPMNEEEIKEAIINPANHVNLKLRPDLIERITHDVLNSPGSLPILQYTLTKLYEEAETENTILTIGDYNRLGPIHRILSKRANKIYDELKEPLQKEPLQKVAQRLFLELVQINQGSITRRRVYLKDLENSTHTLKVLDKVKDILVAERLITVDKNSKLDIAHESLIHHWDKFKGWIREYQSALNLKQEIEAKATKWEKNNRSDNPGLILQGQTLEEAEAYRNKYKQIGLISGLAEEYITFSREVEKRDQKARQAKDEKHHRELEDERKKTSLQKKKTTLQEQSNKVLTLLPNRPLVLPEDILDALIKAVETIDLNLDPLQLPKEALSSVEKLAQHPGEILGVVQNSLNQAMTKAIVPNICNSDHYVLAVAFSPNGDKIISGCGDCKLRLWDIHGNLIDAWEGHQQSVTSVAFNRDGLIVSGSYDKTIRLWDIDGKLIGTWEGHNDAVKAVAFSPDGQMVVSGSHDKTIRLWDINGNLKAIGKGHDGTVLSVAFSSDGKTIVSGGADNRLCLWDINSNLNGNLRPTSTWKGHDGNVLSVAFSPDGKTIVSGGRDSLVCLWNINSNDQPKLIGDPWRGHSNFVNSVAFSLDGETIVSGEKNGNILLWDKPSNNRSGIPRQVLRGHTSCVYGVAFSPDGETIVSGSEDYTVRLWDIRDNAIGKPWRGDQKKIYAVAFSPNGETIVSGSENGTLCLWDINDKLERKPIGKSWKAHEKEVSAVAFSPNGDKIISGSADCTLQLWDINGKPIGKPWRGHEKEVYAVAFSCDEMVVSAGADCKLRLWDINGNPKGEWDDRKEYIINAVAFSPDGQYIISGNDNGEVILRNIDGQIIERLGYSHPNKGQIMGVAFSPNQQMIVSGSENGTVCVWRKEDNKYRGSYQYWETPAPENTSNFLNAVAFSPDGQMIISTSGNDDAGKLHLWDLDGNYIGEPLEGHDKCINAVAFSPDGKMIVSGSDDCTLRLWRGNWQVWLEVCAQRLLPLVLKDPTNQMFENICQICAERDLWKDKDCGKIFKMQGDDLSKRGKVESAIDRYKQAMHYDPDLCLNPEVEAKRRAAPFLLKKSEMFTLRGNIEEAIKTYIDAREFDPNIEASKEQLNNLCWFGTINGHYDDPEIIAACNKTVGSQPDHVDVSYLDSRGLCRALNDNFEGAIKDFERFIASSNDQEKISTKKSWIKRLRAKELPTEINKLKKKNG